MTRRALGYIARTGPSSPQDRWEENEGINPFTLGVGIAALVAGAALLPQPESDWALALADFWNEHIEAWMTVTGTELARQHDIPGYYLRVAPPEIVNEAARSEATVLLSIGLLHPKSMRNAAPSALTRMFSGLKSPCRTLSRWRKRNPSSAWARGWTTSAHGRPCI